tara:strand:+ start:28337 stop:29584 length:1248 start_codon:yes stop_codon:yes gene_type:complete
MKGIFYQNKRSIFLNSLLFLVAFSLPFSLAFNSLSIILFSLFCLSFFKVENIKTLLNYKQVYFYFILFYLFQIFSYSYSYDKNLALDNLIKNIVYLILPIAFVSVKMFLNKNSFNALFNGLLMSIILSLIKVYWHILRSIFTSTFELKYFLREGFVENGIFKIHVPYFSMLIVFLIVYVVKIEFLRNKNWNLVLKTSILLLLIVSLFLLSGLMSVFLFVLFCIYLVFKNPCNRSLKIKLFIIIFSIITATFIFIKNMEKLEGVRGAENIFFRVQNLMNSDSYVRIENWKSVTEVISENFFFGVGVDGGITELLKKREPLTEPFVNKHNAHNTLLETMLRYGFFGLVIFCLIIFHLISISIKTMNYYFSWFLIIFLLSSLTESYLQRQIGLIFFVFFSLFFYTANITKITKKLVHK